jgi:alpha-galactosidase
MFTGADRYTCGGRFGSLDYEEIDAKTYAEWEIDYLSKISGRSFTLGPVLNFIRDQNMITAITRARVGLRSFHSTGTRRCPVH